MGSGIGETKPTSGVFALGFRWIVPTDGKGRGPIRPQRSRLVRLDILL